MKFPSYITSKSVQSEEAAYFKALIKRNMSENLYVTDDSKHEIRSRNPDNYVGKVFRNFEKTQLELSLLTGRLNPLQFGIPDIGHMDNIHNFLEGITSFANDLLDLPIIHPRSFDHKYDHLENLGQKLALIAETTQIDLKQEKGFTVSYPTPFKPGKIMNSGSPVFNDDLTKILMRDFPITADIEHDNNEITISYIEPMSVSLSVIKYSDISTLEKLKTSSEMPDECFDLDNFKPRYRKKKK